MISHTVKVLFISFIFAVSATVHATTFYVSPAGTSSGNGSLANPYNFSAAIGKTLTANDSVIIRGGMYNFISAQNISKSGAANGYLHIVAYQGESPVFDFRKQLYSSSSQGVKLSGSYVHLKGIIVQGAGDNGIQMTGSNNIIEHCTTRWNCDSGMQMKTGSNNLILNCDSYENFDYESGGIATPDFGGNADGFADKQYTNAGTNTYKGCRSWRNGDDGWDSYEKTGNTVYDSCWSYAMAPATFDMTDNIRFKTDSATWFYQFKDVASGRYIMKNYGNGNGFKLGGNYTVNNATVHNCLSAGNKVKGYDQNNNAGIMTVYNCTSYNNGNNYGFSNSTYGKLIIKNCASLSSKGSNSFNSKSVTQAYNSWNPGFTCVAADFINLDDAQLLNDRKQDGSLPEISFLHLASTSGMIDKGIDVGLPFVGLAPDLGACEYNPETTEVLSAPSIDTEVTVYYSTLNHEISIQGSIADIGIYCVTGQEIYTRKIITDQLMIPVTNIFKGIYLVRVKTQLGSIVAKKILID